MLVNKKETRNFQAVSATNVQDGTGTPIAYFNANYSGNDLAFNMNIVSFSLYKENKETVDADYETFKNEVIEKLM